MLEFQYIRDFFERMFFDVFGIGDMVFLFSLYIGDD